MGRRCGQSQDQIQLVQIFIFISVFKFFLSKFIVSYSTLKHSDAALSTLILI